MSDADFDPAHHVVESSVSVAQLEVKTAFSGLTDTEKLYAHFIASASWEGSKICLLQCSPESPAVFSLLQVVFQQAPAELRAAATAAGVSEDEFKAFMTYAAAFYSNMGNYRSFGDTKIVPGLPKDRFEAVLNASAAFAASDAGEPGGAKALWAAVGDAIYDLSPRMRELGLGADKGISTYYSSNCTKEDADLLQRFMDAKGISAYNTRVFKAKEPVDGKPSYELWQAAATKGTTPGYDAAVDFEGASIRVMRGDYAPLMARVCDNLREAVKHAANERQKAMLNHYIASFDGGSIDEHKAGSREWVTDKSPSVESYIGFIESYRDPAGTKGEWEGFVAVVNRETSAKFATLVAKAPESLPKLPWGAAWEKDVFSKPDFTALEVVAFGSSGIPAGINIPNYDDIRQGFGFKNVSLSNVLSARDVKERVSFLADADQELFQSLVVPSFEVQVGLHELLGHGSGKLLKRGEDGSFNFDKEGLINPETGAPVETWYEPGQTYDSVWSPISSSLEECRAECVGIYLCVDEDVLKIFGHEGEEARKIVYVNWLSMARAGLMALMFYSPATKQHGQAHMQARFAILQVMIEAGVAEIVNAERAAEPAGGAGEEGKEETPGAGERGVYIKVHEDRIRTAGVAAIGSFLRRIQIYKATADFKRGKEMYDRYTAVSDSMLALRALVLANRKPRPMFVQPVTRVAEGEAAAKAADGSVELKTFDATVEGIAESFAARFPAKDAELLDLWEEDKKRGVPVEA